MVDIDRKIAGAFRPAVNNIAYNVKNEYEQERLRAILHVLAVDIFAALKDNDERELTIIEFMDSCGF